jgi:hypothetical protein
MFEDQTNRASQAPGEADPELAYLNKAGMLDAVLSDDGDMFAFGATHVIRKYVPPPSSSICLLTQCSMLASMLKMMMATLPLSTPWKRYRRRRV